MFDQKDQLKNFIFPLIRATKKSAGYYEYGELIGTGFFIGARGYALTAGHVIDQLFDVLPKNGAVLAIFSDSDGNWHPYEIIEKEKHSSEDVGIIKVNGDWWNSLLEIDIVPGHSGQEYHCWGYPRVVAKEVTKIQESGLERPELIFTQGYIRRRISRELEVVMYIGCQFYELSEIVGEGNSGGPVILKTSVRPNQPMKLLGVYIGEKSSKGIDISYAVRSEAFMNWSPTILGKTVLQEANL